jgi:hypothetical protein
MDEDSMDQIVYKIYFEFFSFDSIKEYLFPALRKMENPAEFFDIVLNILRKYV